MKRYTYLAGSAVADGANSGLTEVPSVDDQVARTLTGVYMEPATAKVQLQLAGGGFTFAKMDAAIFAAGNERVRLAELFPPTIKFQINIVNNSGGSYTGNVTLEYEPGPGSGGVSGAR